MYISQSLIALAFILKYGTQTFAMWVYCMLFSCVIVFSILSLPKIDFFNSKQEAITKYTVAIKFSS